MRINDTVQLKLNNFLIEIARQVTLRNPTYRVECVSAPDSTFHFPALRLRIANPKTVQYYDKIIDSHILMDCHCSVEGLARHVARDLCESLIQANI